MALVEEVSSKMGGVAGEAAAVSPPAALFTAEATATAAAKLSRNTPVQALKVECSATRKEPERKSLEGEEPVRTRILSPL